MVYSKRSLVQQLSELNLTPDKANGQNYLISATICEAFAKSAALDPEKDTVLEIGPGLGQVTEFLVDQCEQLYLIELESVCARFLEKKLSARYPTTRITGRKAIQLGEIPATTRIVIVEGDTLTIPFPKVTKVVSSVPYSICYELMLKFINTWQYQSIHLILQKEFIDHVLADVGENGYTVMAAFAGFYLNGERVLDIPNDAFFPEPDVQSLITKYTPKDTLSADAPERPYREKYLAFLRGIFPYVTWPLKRAVQTFQEKKSKIALDYPHLIRAVDRSEYAETWVRNIPSTALFQIMLDSFHYSP